MEQRTAELTEKLTEFLGRYYQDEIAQLAQRYPREQQSLHIDYGDVYRFDAGIADDLVERPRKVLNYFSEALRLYELPVDIDLADAHIRVESLPDDHVLDVPKVSRHDNIGSLVGLRGQVQKVSAVKPRPVEAAFECKRCGTMSYIFQDGDSLQEPHECQGCERQGPFVLDETNSEWENHQTARVQEPPEKTRGGRGQTIDIDLEDDLIEGFDAGDRVTIAGVMGVEEPTDNHTRDFDTRVSANSVTREESDYEDIDIEEHREEIEAIADGKHGDPFRLLTDSVNPQHKGDREVKLAIALQMFGGWSRDGEQRGDSHILLMGDPGCGKSTFLQAVDELAPRSTYASGKGATAAGLTAAAVSDDFGDSEWGLEAGALVLADGGVACIDEIDKVNDNAIASLHDALESQKVRINKAGMNATLNSRTALLAAGNPEKGRFDPYVPIPSQIDLGPTLLSRFDLLFMVSDSVDEETDREVIDHMMRSRRATAKQELGEVLSEEEEQSIEPAIPREVLRAYIALAKQEVTPYIHSEDTEVQEYLRESFLQMRLANQNDDGDDAVPVTYRQEQAIERLAEAAARVRLSNRVTKDDVDLAVDLWTDSMSQVGVDPETGKLDSDVIETGSSTSQKQRRDMVKAEVINHDAPTADEIAENVDIEKDKVEAAIKYFLDRGAMYDTGQGYRMT